MAISSTLGQFLLNEALPSELRDYNRVLDKSNINKLFNQIADKHPDKYKDIAKNYYDIARESAYTTGGQSFGIQHLKQSPAVLAIKDKINKEVFRISMDPNYKDKLDAKTGLTDRERAIVEMADKHQDLMSKTVFNDHIASNNPLAEQVKSGARGNKANLNSLLGADLLYTDHKDRHIPIPVLRNYSQGLSPVEYYAGSFGARSGVISVKQGTQESGDLSKQSNRAAHRLIITHRGEDEHDDDGPTRGLPVKTLDHANIGALLAHPFGPYKRNTILTDRIINDLHDKGHERILVRSPLVGGAPDGGLRAHDVGIREKGVLPPMGDFIGLAAAQALSEPVTQAGLCLHEDTLVRMADWSIKKIKDIQSGDSVLGASLDGAVKAVKVINTYSNGIKDCFNSIFKYGNTQMSLISTKEHKLLTWLETIATLEDIEKNKDKLLVQTNKGIAKLISMSKVEECETFDLEVDHPDHLFVLANGLIVSNSSKHKGGVSEGISEGATGFDLINQLMQVPKTYPGGSTHAEHDGKVMDMVPNPAGGTHIMLSGNKKVTPHFVPPDRTITVKKNQEIEAGDPMTDGIPNAARLVEHKGIGEGRRQFIGMLASAYDKSGIPAHRRNIEVLGRALIDHVKMTEEVGNNLPTDIIPYHMVERDWKPRPGWTSATPGTALNKYLEKPVLHYSIGTKIRPSVVKELNHFGVKNIMVHHEPPPFEPIMVRTSANINYDPDWMTRMLGPNMKKFTLKGVHRGDVSDESSTSYVPGLAKGVDFGRVGAIQDWHQADPSVVPGVAERMEVLKASSFGSGDSLPGPPIKTPHSGINNAEAPAINLNSRLTDVYSSLRKLQALKSLQPEKVTDATNQNA